jgi:hypothetical protein
MKDFPKDFGRLGEQIQVLHELIEKNADATVIGRAAAPIYLDSINRILAHFAQFDATFGFEFLASNLTSEEYLPRANTCLRMLGELNTMLLEQLEGLLNCFGGAAVVGLQHLEEWAVGNQVRQEFLQKFLAAAAHRARRSRR